MVNWRDDDESADDELADHEVPDDADVDDDSIDLLTCPECGAEIYPDIAVCPRCGYFIPETQPIYRKPLWIVLGVVLCLVIIVILWLK